MDRKAKKKREREGQRDIEREAKKKGERELGRRRKR